MGMSCLVLGSSGSYPGPGRACSSYLVRSGGTSLWMDAGSGSLGNLQLHVGLDSLDAVVLSHEHVDHWQDLEGLAVAAHYVLGLEPIPVYAPAGVRRRYAGPPDALEFHTVSDGSEVSVGGLLLRFSRTDHGPETLAVRVEGEGRALGYSADTGPSWPLSSLGVGLDLALCEATYLQDREGSFQHMSARQAGHSARSAAAGQLVITHIQPGVDRDAARAEAEAAFGADVMVATEHLELEL
jgi:ribonuclease BN (tRNA processing enzyme)